MAEKLKKIVHKFLVYQLIVIIIVVVIYLVQISHIEQTMLLKTAQTTEINKQI